MTKRQKLTNRELDILNILWASEKPLTASEISTVSEGVLTINVVQAMLRKLLKQNLIEVADIVYSGTVLCRNYKPTNASKEQIIAQFSDEFRRFQKEFSLSSLWASLLDQEEDPAERKQQIIDLENFLEEYKNSMEKFC